MKSPVTHFFLALFVLIGVISCYGVWYRAISQKSNKVANLENQIIAASENVGRIALARAALSEIEGDEAHMQNYFVSESSAVSFINELETLGLSQKATVTVLSVAKGGLPSRPTLVLALSIKGTFDAVMRTVGAIEYVPYSISISTLSVGQDMKDSWHANLNLIADSAFVASTTVSTP
ncbi:MAG: hypothetical protein NTV60_03465 [Candidatus Kaiserbacteria bacterium]|nr:hypothetical protein [Candidatus Kaiserbacteria bacterium]